MSALTYGTAKFGLLRKFTPTHILALPLWASGLEIKLELPHATSPRLLRAHLVMKSCLIRTTTASSNSLQLRYVIPLKSRLYQTQLSKYYTWVTLRKASKNSISTRQSTIRHGRNSVENQDPLMLLPKVVRMWMFHQMSIDYLIIKLF